MGRINFHKTPDYNLPGYPTIDMFCLLEKRNWLAGLLMIISITSFAQDEKFDVWSTIRLQKKWYRWDFSAETELRSSGFYQHTDRLSLQGEACYDVKKWLKAGALYQVINFYDSKYDDYQLRNRFGAYVQGKKKWGGFTFSLQEQLQLTTKDESDRIKNNGETDTYKVNPSVVWLNKLKMKYHFTDCPLTPAFSAETFYQLNDPDGNTFTKIRYTLSLDYTFARRHHFEISGKLDNKLDNPENKYILGIGYTFAF